MEITDITLRQGDNIILVIDTDSYAGNFERQLCGFVTGVWDMDRVHGEGEAVAASADHPEMIAAISAKVTMRHHVEYGDCSNAIRATPGRLNNGLGFCFNANDAVAAAAAKQRAKDDALAYNATQIEMCERRLREEDFETQSSGWTKDACERTIVSNRQMIERAGEHNHPAFESVAIFLHTPLTPEELAFVERRADEYGKANSIGVLEVYQVNARQIVEETRI